MAMVSNKLLGALAVRLGLHRHLHYNDTSILGQIGHYAEDIKIAEDESNGAMDYWLGNKDPPKVDFDQVLYIIDPPS
jgi:endoribonuclease Dicer